MFRPAFTPRATVVRAALFRAALAAALAVALLGVPQAARGDSTATLDPDGALGYVPQSVAACTPSQSGAAVPVASSGRVAVRTTIGVAKSMAVPKKGEIIAVMVMFQESSIRNLANDGTSPSTAAWPSPGRDYWLRVTKLSLKYPHDRFGLLNGAHDTDSVGLYQQRPSAGWGTYGNSSGITDPEGTVQRLLDPRWEAMAFFGGVRSAAPTVGLLDIPGWQTMPLTKAADAVQHSGHPDYYAKWEKPATDYVNQNQDAAPVGLPWVPGGGGGALACVSIPTDPAKGEAGHNPFGYLDNVQAGATGLAVTGWMIDPDAVNGIGAVRFTDQGPAGRAEYDGLADQQRDDVNRTYNLLGRYGYAATLPLAGFGRHRVCVVGVNVARGTGDSQLGCREVLVPGPALICAAGAGDTTSSGVAAVVTNGTTTAFVTAKDGSVRFRSADRTEGFHSLGGGIKYGPAVVSWGGSRVDAFAVAPSGALYHNWGSVGGDWRGWRSLGGKLTASPAALSFRPGTLEVYGRGVNNQLATIAWTGTKWTAWRSLGGRLTSGPGAAVDHETGLATVGVRGSQGSLWELKFAEHQSAPFLRNISICSAPAYAEGRGGGAGLIPAFLMGDTTVAVGGSPTGRRGASAPAVVRNTKGAGSTSFVRGPDAALWKYRGTPGYGTWSSLGGQLM